MVVIELKSVDISPNECLVESGINIGLSFTCIEDIFNAYWSFSYIVDTVHSRKIVKLGDSPSFQYNRNEVHSTTWSCERIDLKGVTEEVLNNVGVCVCVCVCVCVHLSVFLSFGAYTNGATLNALR
eukprot:GHVR01001838.1.p3 GENE.GHVR01001838.1~~GHVR01001838.1.p3  ORF type:complete len:126 (+),score=26.13 GHVR01001838.1:65-442(+)